MLPLCPLVSLLTLEVALLLAACHGWCAPGPTTRRALSGVLLALDLSLATCGVLQALDLFLALDLEIVVPAIVASLSTRIHGTSHGDRALIRAPPRITEGFDTNPLL